MANTQAQQAMQICKGLQDRLINGPINEHSLLIDLVQALYLTACAANSTVPVSTQIAEFANVPANQTPVIATRTK